MVSVAVRCRAMRAADCAVARYSAMRAAAHAVAGMEAVHADSSRVGYMTDTGEEP